MRQVNINQLRPNLTSEVSNLPFEITKRGRVIAVVNPPNLKVQIKKQSKQDTNLKVQNKVSVLDSGKYDSNGKFITNFKE